MVENKSFGIKGILRYREGDALIPISAGHRLIIHACNTDGKWGRGFVLAISRKWPKPELEYRNWWRSQNKFKLGEIQEVPVQSDTSVINMIAQEGLGPDKEGKPPAKLDALALCLEKVAKLAKITNSSIHAPRICCGLGGLSWGEVEPIIIDKLINKGINVTVYDLPKPKESVKESE